MKTKTQKGEELKRGRELLEKSKFLVFMDFTNVSTEALRKLRQEIKDSGADFLVIKKRLLNLLLKEKGSDFDVRRFGFSVGTIFSPTEIEKGSNSAYKFFSTLEVPDDAEKNFWVSHILGGYDFGKKAFVEAEEIVRLGKLPPREIMLAQLLGTFIAPIRSFLYLLNEKSKRS